MTERKISEKVWDHPTVVRAMALPGELPPDYVAAQQAMKQLLAVMKRPWDDRAAEIAFYRKLLAEWDEQIFKPVVGIKARAVRRTGAMLRACAAEQAAAPRLTPDEWMSAAIAERNANGGDDG